MPLPESDETKDPEINFSVISIFMVIVEFLLSLSNAEINDFLRLKKNAVTIGNGADAEYLRGRFTTFCQEYNEENKDKYPLEILSALKQAFGVFDIYEFLASESTFFFKQIELFRSNLEAKQIGTNITALQAHTDLDPKSINLAYRDLCKRQGMKYALLLSLMGFESNHEAENAELWELSAETIILLSNLVNAFESFEQLLNYLHLFYQNNTNQNASERFFELFSPMSGENIPMTYFQLIISKSENCALLFDNKYKAKFRQFISMQNLLHKVLQINISKDPQSVYTELLETLFSQPGALKEMLERGQMPANMMKLISDLQTLWTNPAATLDDLLNVTMDSLIKFIASLANAEELRVKELLKLGAVPQDVLAVVSHILKPKQHDKLPNEVVTGPKYFICKMDPKDVRGPFLGLMTGCCQYISGPGELAATYGYTNPNSCFYVMFKGASKAKSKDDLIDTSKLNTANIVAQAMTWRCTKDPATIVFDSIEMDSANNTPESQARQKAVIAIFFELAKQIVENPENKVQRVHLGQGAILGACIPDGIFPSKIKKVPIPKDPLTNAKIYSDAEDKEQHCLYDTKHAAICQTWIDIVVLEKNASKGLDDLTLEQAIGIFAKCCTDLSNNLYSTINLFCLLLNKFPELYEAKEFHKNLRFKMLLMRPSSFDTIASGQNYLCTVSPELKDFATKTFYFSHDFNDTEAQGFPEFYQGLQEMQDEAQVLKKKTDIFLDTLLDCKHAGPELLADFTTDNIALLMQTGYEDQIMRLLDWKKFDWDLLKGLNKDGTNALASAAMAAKEQVVLKILQSEHLDLRLFWHIEDALTKSIIPFEKWQRHAEVTEAIRNAKERLEIKSRSQRSTR